jgi:hypothetical protein
MGLGSSSKRDDRRGDRQCQQSDPEAIAGPPHEPEEGRRDCPHDHHSDLNAVCGRVDEVAARRNEEAPPAATRRPAIAIAATVLRRAKIPAAVGTAGTDLCSATTVAMSSPRRLRRRAGRFI